MQNAEKAKARDRNRKQPANSDQRSDLRLK
jgi:hypothetical protein